MLPFFGWDWIFSYYLKTSRIGKKDVGIRMKSVEVYIGDLLFFLDYDHDNGYVFSCAVTKSNRRFPIIFFKVE